MRNRQRSFEVHQSESKSKSFVDATSKPAKTCPYDPEEPLTIPLEKGLERQHTSLAKPRGFHTIVGPLTKVICETLNIPVENSLDMNTKVTTIIFACDESYIHLDYVVQSLYDLYM